jgi:DNA-nicking Smr family endonuclease
VPRPPKFPAHRPFRGLSLGARSEKHERAGNEEPAAKVELTFSRAAAELGVEALPQGKRRVGAEEPEALRVAPPEPVFVVQDEDGWVEGYRSELGPRVLERLRGAPRATLDLHGSRVRAARERLAGFVTGAPYPEVALVLVIVGKGRHSPGGRAVIAREIGSWLSSGSLARRVLAFRTAPPELGGSGGVLVLLKGAPA